MDSPKVLPVHPRVDNIPTDMATGRKSPGQPEPSKARDEEGAVSKNHQNGKVGEKKQNQTLKARKHEGDKEGNEAPQRILIPLMLLLPITGVMAVSAIF